MLFSIIRLYDKSYYPFQINVFVVHFITKYVNKIELSLRILNHKQRLS